MVILSQEEERAIVSQSEDLFSVDSAVECGSSSKTSTLDDKTSVSTPTEFDASTGDSTSMKFHPTPKPRRIWNSGADQSNNAQVTHVDEPEPVTWTSVVDWPESSPEPQDESSGEISTPRGKCLPSDDADDGRGRVESCLENPVFWLACYFVASLHYFLGIDIFLTLAIIIAFFSLISAVVL